MTSAFRDPEPVTAAILEVSAFLFREAALLDEWRFEEWLDLFTDDATYWVPGPHVADPAHTVSLIYDDRVRLAERVRRLQSRFAHTQDPPSRTCHLVGNVRILGAVEGELEVTSNLVLTEVRRGVQTIYSGQVVHRLLPAAGSWKVREKVVRLLNSDLPLGAMSFLL